MLTLKARGRTELKCPRHPREQYEIDRQLPDGCESCRAIYDALEAAHVADRRIVKAQQAISRQHMGGTAA